jgi:membrane protein
LIPGAIFSTLAWMSISHLFSIYISNFGDIAEAYGSLGGIIILLIWIYWCGLAIMLGAEINATLYYFRKKKNNKV